MRRGPSQANTERGERGRAGTEERDLSCTRANGMPGAGVKGREAGPVLSCHVTPRTAGWVGRGGERLQVLPLRAERDGPHVDTCRPLHFMFNHNLNVLCINKYC